MNLESEKFLELLELYPETAENLKLRALEKRSIFMYYKRKVSQRDYRGKQVEIKEVSPEKSKRESGDLYKSTYHGEELDSDLDEFHITMPFKHSDELHQDVLYNTKFESDESFELEDKEKDKFLTSVLC